MSSIFYYSFPLCAHYILDKMGMIIKGFFFLLKPLDIFEKHESQSLRPLWHIDYLTFQKTELRHLEKPGTVNHSTLALWSEDKGQLSNTVNDNYLFSHLSRTLQSSHDLLFQQNICYLQKGLTRENGRL